MGTNLNHKRKTMKRVSEYTPQMIDGLKEFFTEADPESRLVICEKLEEMLDDLNNDDFFGTEC